MRFLEWQFVVEVINPRPEALSPKDEHPKALNPKLVPCKVPEGVGFRGLGV